MTNWHKKDRASSVFSAEGETRTRMAAKPHAPETCASTNSATSAWSEKRGSNPRPSAWEADALPTELLSHNNRKFHTLQSNKQIKK